MYFYFFHIMGHKGLYLNDFIFKGNYACILILNYYINLASNVMMFPDNYPLRSIHLMNRALFLSILLLSLDSLLVNLVMSERKA